MVTLPKLRLVGFALSAPGVTPVPDTVIAKDGLEPFEATVTVPLMLPLDFGENVIVNVVLCDPPRLSGVDIPLIVNALLSTDTPEIDTLEESLFVIVTTCDVVVPTATLPKASLLGLSASRPVPVPESATLCIPFEASLLMDSVALNTAAAFGVNEILRFVLCPAASTTGNVVEANAKYLVDAEALLMFTVLFPEFVSVSVRLLLVFGATLPKLRLALPIARFPIC